MTDATRTSVSYEPVETGCRITIDDGKVNALTLALLADLGAALDRAEADGRPVILTGREGRFSAGFDLATLTGGGPDGPTLLRTGFELSERLLGFPVPVVLACSGHALAMGSFLLLSADYRIGAAGPFKIGANEVAIGMTMPMTAIEICRLRVAPTYYSRVVMNAEIFDPQGAIAPGFLDEVVAPASLEEAALAAAARLGTLDLRAHAATKRRARAGALAAIHDAIEADDEAFRQLAG